MTDSFDSAEDQVRRDRWGRYLLPPAAVHGDRAASKEVSWTRATTFAKSISDTYALSMWQQRMAVKGVALRQDLRMAAATLDVKSDKDKLNEVVEAAKEAAEAKSAARLGSAAHSFTEQYDGAKLSGVEWDLSLAQEYQPHIELYAATLEQFGITVLPDMIERIVAWTKYGVAGTFDRLGLWNGQPIVLDLKTGRDLTYGWNEIAIQLCVYAHADGVWNPGRWTWEPMPEGLNTETALVVHLPVADGKSPSCTIYQVDLREALMACQLCYDVREWRKTRNLAVPLEPPAPGHPSTVWPERIAASAAIGDLMTVWRAMPDSERTALKSMFADRATQLRELAG